MQRNTLHSTMSKAMESQKEVEMERRLRSNPMDSEANAYFGEKIQKQNVDNQYRQMMEEFPESMGKVLMLYIDAKVNNHPIQAFVDSGAQSSKFSQVTSKRRFVFSSRDLLFSFNFLYDSYHVFQVCRKVWSIAFVG